MTVLQSCRDDELARKKNILKVWSSKAELEFIFIFCTRNMRCDRSINMHIEEESLLCYFAAKH
jgi:hypothetical protein